MPSSSFKKQHFLWLTLASKLRYSDLVNLLCLIEMALLFLHNISKFVFKGAAGSPVWVTPFWYFPVVSGYKQGSTASPGAEVLLLCAQLAERILPLKHCLHATLILLLWRWWTVHLWAYLCIAQRIFRKFRRDVWLWNDLILQTKLGLVQISSFKDPLLSYYKIHVVLLLLLKQHIYKLSVWVSSVFMSHLCLIKLNPSP